MRLLSAVQYSFLFLELWFQLDAALRSDRLCCCCLLFEEGDLFWCFAAGMSHRLT